ncbi:STAS domain-containing protein [Methylogaea oryzae]|uniref:STAS domain-containing protein n=1 Tax=Methylogaea oryzae TaxID=1295382 RepID=UPI0020D1DD18|nr:STAS domain-containing protein [Methylogaea oryzae]
MELDLSGVRRADSAGLALLVEWLAQANRLNRQLDFRHVPDQILRMAKVGGLEDILSL